MKIKLLLSSVVLMMLFGCSGSDDSSSGGSNFYKVTMDGSTKTYNAAPGDHGLAYGNGGFAVFSMASTSNGGGAINVTNYDNNWEAGDYSSGVDDIVISVVSSQNNYVAMENLSYTITSNNGSVIQGTFEGTFENFSTSETKQISGSFKGKVYTLGN
jgi:hypothetical protein